MAFYLGKLLTDMDFLRAMALTFAAFQAFRGVGRSGAQCRTHDIGFHPLIPVIGIPGIICRKAARYINAGRAGLAIAAAGAWNLHIAVDF